MWREICALKCRLLKVELGIFGCCRDLCFPSPDVILANEISVQPYLNSLPLLNRHRLKPGEKQLAIYGSRNPWPGGIADFLEQLCLEPQAHSVGRSFSRRVKIQFGSHSCRSSHRVVEQAPALRLRQKLIILESRAVGQGLREPY